MFVSWYLIKKDKMKRTIAFILALVMVSVLCGCGSRNGNSAVEYDMDLSSFVEANEFSKLEPLINEYYDIIINSYNNSDKRYLKSFKPNSSYTNTYNSIVAIVDSFDRSAPSNSVGENEVDTRLLELKLVAPITKIQLHLAARDFLLSAGIQKNEEWFTELAEDLSAAELVYKTGI